MVVKTPDLRKETWEQETMRRSIVLTPKATAERTEIVSPAVAFRAILLYSL